MRTQKLFFACYTTYCLKLENPKSIPEFNAYNYDKQYCENQENLVVPKQCKLAQEKCQNSFNEELRCGYGEHAMMLKMCTYFIQGKTMGQRHKVIKCVSTSLQIKLQ